MRGSPFALVCVLLACGEVGPEGNRVKLSFGDASVVGIGGADASTPDAEPDSSPDASPDGAPDAEPDVAPTFGPPVVDSFTPEGGPWGTRVTIGGSDLGSAARGGDLGIESGLELAPDAVEVESWSETEIVFRVPLPHEGEVTVATDEGSVVAGSFVSTHELAEPLPLSDDRAVLGSVSGEVGEVALALESDFVALAQFAGGEWTTVELPDTQVRGGTLRLYRDSAGALRAFALSADDPPEVLVFSGDDSGWAVEETGVTTSENYRLAGAADGAAVWFFDTDGWYRARPVDDVWEVDKGPIVNPYEGALLANVAATSDGSLFATRARATGSLLDDTGAPFARWLAPDATSFGSEAQTGQDVDDYLTELQLFDRGRGLVVYYCGSDQGLGGSGKRCYWSSWRQGGTVDRATRTENDHNRIAFTSGAQLLARCEDQTGTLVSSSASGGDVWAWPCEPVAALEIDPTGAPLLVLRHESGLVLVRER